MPEEIPSAQEMLQNKPKIEGRVRFILENYPPTRGDDVLLYRKYLMLYTDVRLTAREFEKFFRIPAPESISRARRKIQKPTSENPILMPTKRVKRKRAINEDGNRAYYSDRQTRLIP